VKLNPPKIVALFMAVTSLAHFSRKELLAFKSYACWLDLQAGLNPYLIFQGSSMTDLTTLASVRLILKLSSVTWQGKQHSTATQQHSTATQKHSTARCSNSDEQVLDGRKKV
jgi:hypothetical protein